MDAYGIIRHSWWGKILAEHDTEPTEVASGVMKVGLGLFLLLPGQTFTNPVYALLAALPEPLWGGILVVLGVVHILAVRDGSRVWRRRMALAGFLMWCLFTLSFALGNILNTGCVVYGLLAFGQGWCYIRLGRRAI